MLPPEHLVVRRRKGIIRPMYATERKTGLAKTLISVHKDHIGRKRRELSAALASCEELGYEFKLVRGLSSVLGERCSFESQATLLPYRARRAVFQEAGRKVIATEEDRRRVMAAVAFRLGVSTLDLDKNLYADLEDEQTLTGIEEIQPLDLLKVYNFSLTTGLLAHAQRLELTYKGEDEEIERLAVKIGKSGFSKNGDMSKLVSKWRPTSRMGYKAVQLEAILARLLNKNEWSLSADVIYPNRSRKAYHFEIRSAVEGRLMKSGAVGRRPSERKKAVIPVPSKSRGEVIIISDVARRLRITEAEVREMHGDRGFLDLGSILIMRERRDEIERALEEVTDMRLKAVKVLLRGLGVRSPVPVLEALGYDIDWNREQGESLVYRLERRKSSA